MAIKSVCDACGMTLNEKASFCPTCGGRMNVIEEAAVAVDENTMQNQPEIPSEENPAADNPALNAAMNNSGFAPDNNDIPPVGNNIPPVPPINNNSPIGSNIPPYSAPNNTYGYQQPQMNQPEAPKSGKDTMALVGMILGIVSLALCCLNLIMLPVAIAGLIFAILGIKSIRRKGMAIAGIICSAIAALLCIVIFCEGLATVKDTKNAYENIFEDILEDEDLDGILDDYEYNYKYNWD